MKELSYWKANCEDDYTNTPISVLRYIAELEKELLNSGFEVQRLHEWLQDPNREPAQTRFTAGITRNVAKEIEFLIFSL